MKIPNGTLVNSRVLAIAMTSMPTVTNGRDFCPLNTKCLCREWIRCGEAKLRNPHVFEKKRSQNGGFAILDQMIERKDADGVTNGPGVELTHGIGGDTIEVASERSKRAGHVNEAPKKPTNKPQAQGQADSPTCSTDQGLVESQSRAFAIEKSDSEVSTDP